MVENSPQSGMTVGHRNALFYLPVPLRYRQWGQTRVKIADTHRNTVKMKGQMTTIPTRFSRAGFDYEQIKRNGLNAIFAQKCKGTVIAYEVVQIKVAPPERMFGKDYPEREVYPGNEEWGSIAWSCPTLERAVERYNGLEVAA